MRARPGDTFDNNDPVVGDTSALVLAIAPHAPAATQPFFPTPAAFFPLVLAALIALFLSTSPGEDAVRVV